MRHSDAILRIDSTVAVAIDAGRAVRLIATDVLDRAPRRTSDERRPDVSWRASRATRPGGRGYEALRVTRGV